jgi:AcrR family transcriptional regulator
LKRALGTDEKSARRAAIVRAAEALLHRDPAARFSVAALARRAGLAKGTVYLYFRTREEVLLALHERQLHELFDVLERALEQPRASARSVVRAGLRHHAGHPEFYPLAGRCRDMLDTNVGAEAALAFHIGLAQRLERLGGRVERLYPALRPGEGAALLVNSYALIVGLWQQADIPAVLRRAMARPDLKVFRVDFASQLERALLDLWEAAERRGRGGQ